MLSHPNVIVSRVGTTVLVGVLVGCAERPPAAFPSAEPAPLAASTADPDSTPEKREAPGQGVPAGALDIPEGGCLATEGDPDAVCTAARTLPTALTRIPTKLNGLLSLPGGTVHNHSARDIFVIGSVPRTASAGPWEIVRVPAGASLGGDLSGGHPQTTTDVDWVSATPPTPDGKGGFTYAPLALGVKIFDGGELTVVDRPGGGVRFWLNAAGSLPSKITTAGQMNGGSAIVYLPRH
jgi:hypothetical protein